MGFGKMGFLWGLVGVAMAAALTVLPAASAYAATNDIWAGEVLTVTFQLPALTNLDWTPQVGESGVTVTETANVGDGFTTGLGSFSGNLIAATTNTFTVTLTVPAPQYDILYPDVYFSLALPIDNQVQNGLASGGTSTETYTYVNPPVVPPGQMPEVPWSVAVPAVGLAAVAAAKRPWRLARSTMPVS